MRTQITLQVRQGLVPALGETLASAGPGTPPRGEEAYDLYLRSIAVPHDVAPTKDAIAMLERAVGIDPSYAPAWAALGMRYYYESIFGDGGEPMLKRSDSGPELDFCRRGTDYQPDGSRQSGSRLSAGLAPGSATTRQRLGPLCSGLCAALCRVVG